MVETACFTPKNYSAQAAWVSSIQASGGVLTLARMPRSGVSNLSMLRYSLGDETAAPTLIGEFTLGTTPPLYAVPADAQAFGPTLFVSQGASSNFEGVTSFDLSLGVPAITAAVPLAMPNHGRMAVAGPYLIVPSFLAGTTVYQMY